MSGLLVALRGPLRGRVTSSFPVEVLDAIDKLAAATDSDPDDLLLAARALALGNRWPEADRNPVESMRMAFGDDFRRHVHEYPKPPREEKKAAKAEPPKNRHERRRDAVIARRSGR